MNISPKMDQYYKILETIYCAIARENYTLTQHPDLLWQQIYNRLQWEDGQVNKILEPELQKRQEKGASPWFKLVKPFGESSSLIRTLEGHTDPIETCAFSPDGSLIVSGSWNDNVKIWDAETGREKFNLMGYAENTKSALYAVYCCAFSPDGTTILTAGADKTLKLWDTITGQQIGILRGHKGQVTSCTYSPNGRYIVSASTDKTVKLWRTETGKEVATFLGHLGWVKCCAFSQDSRLVVSGSSDKTLKIWNIFDLRKEIATLKGHKGRVWSCAFNPDNSLIASAGSDKTIHLWDVKTGELLATFKGHTNSVTSVMFSPDGLRIASSSYDQTIKIWEVNTGKILASLAGHTGWINSMMVSPDGKKIVSAGWDKTIKLWDITTNKQREIREENIGSIDSCDFSPDGSKILLSGKKTKLVSSEKLEVLTTLEGSKGSFSLDGSFILSAGAGHTVRIWDGETYRQLASLKGHTKGINCCDFSPDGTMIASASDDKNMRFWDLVKGRKKPALTNHHREVRFCKFSPDGSQILSASYDQVKLHDATTGAVFAEIDDSQRDSICTFSPDGSKIIYVNDENKFTLWHVKSQKKLAVLEGNAGDVTACIFSPDGSKIITVDKGRYLRIHNANNGHELSAIRLSSDLLCVGTASNKSFIVCGGTGGNAYFLDIVGMNFSPTIVTAMEIDGELVVRCPFCFQLMQIKEEWLGSVVSCSLCGCQDKMRINSFSIERSKKQSEISKKKLGFIQKKYTFYYLEKKLTPWFIMVVSVSALVYGWLTNGFWYALLGAGIAGLCAKMVFYYGFKFSNMMMNIFNRLTMDHNKNKI